MNFLADESVDGPIVRRLRELGHLKTMKVGERTTVKWAALGFTLCVLAIVVAADRGTLPSVITALYAFPGGDKVGHFLLFGGLALLVSFVMPVRPVVRPWLGILIGGLAIGAAVGVEELTQGLLSTRNASWEDLASSGIAFFCWIAWRLRRGRKGIT